MLSRTTSDMLAGLRAALGREEYRAARSDDARALILAYAVCTALAERRTVYIPTAAALRRQVERATRNLRIQNAAARGASGPDLARRYALSPRQIDRILKAADE